MAASDTRRVDGPIVALGEEPLPAGDAGTLLFLVRIRWPNESHRRRRPSCRCSSASVEVSLVNRGDHHWVAGRLRRIYKLRLADSEWYCCDFVAMSL